MKFGKIAIALCLTVVAPFAAAGKVVVLDHQIAMLATDFAKSRFEALQANPEFSKVVAQYETLSADLTALGKEAETKGMTWGAEQVANHRKKEEYIKADLQLAYQKIQAERKAANESIIRELQPKLEGVLNKLIESDGIDIILSKQAAFYASENADITRKVVDALNKAK